MAECPLCFFLIALLGAPVDVSAQEFGCITTCNDGGLCCQLYNNGVRMFCHLTFFAITPGCAKKSAHSRQRTRLWELGCSTAARPPGCPPRRRCRNTKDRA